MNIPRLGAIPMAQTSLDMLSVLYLVISRKSYILDSLCGAFGIFNNNLKQIFPLGSRITNRCSLEHPVHATGHTLGW